MSRWEYGLVMGNADGWRSVKPKSSGLEPTISNASRYRQECRNKPKSGRMLLLWSKGRWPGFTREPPAVPGESTACSRRTFPIVFAIMSKQQPTESLSRAYHCALRLLYTLWCTHQHAGASRGVSQPCCQDLHQRWLPFLCYPVRSHPWFHQPSAGGRTTERRDLMETHHT